MKIANGRLRQQGGVLVVLILVSMVLVVSTVFVTSLVKLARRLDAYPDRRIDEDVTNNIAPMLPDTNNPTSITWRLEKAWLENRNLDPEMPDWWYEKYGVAMAGYSAPIEVRKTPIVIALIMDDSRNITLYMTNTQNWVQSKWEDLNVPLDMMGLPAHTDPIVLQNSVRVVLQSSTNFVHWENLCTLDIVPGTQYFTQDGINLCTFYRVVR